MKSGPGSPLRFTLTIYRTHWCKSAIGGFSPPSRGKRDRGEQHQRGKEVRGKEQRIVIGARTGNPVEHRRNRHQSQRERRRGRPGGTFAPPNKGQKQVRNQQRDVVTFP